MYAHGVERQGDFFPVMGWHRPASSGRYVPMPKKNARLPGKKDVARAILLKGSLFVHLDPRREGVLVPKEYKAHPQLVLQFGLDLPVPIPDLRVDRSGVRGTLSFQRTLFTCVVPWDSVFAVVGDDGRGMVWPTSMPKEIAVEVDREAERARVMAADQAAGGVRAGNGHASRRRTSARTVRTDDASGSPAQFEDMARASRGDEDDGSQRVSRVQERDDILGVPVHPLRVLPSPAPPPLSARVARAPRRPRTLPPYLRVVK